MASVSIWPLAAHAQQASGAVALPTVEVAGSDAAEAATEAAAEPAVSPETFYQTPTGQVETTIPASRMIDTQAFSVFDVLRDSPGISMKQGNGPRDVGISIRGSNARNGFGIRNIVIFEDGFPVTQPDGLSRTDLTDPHAYGAIDVIRGPSSALYGNYATGGALNFRLRRGGEIDGIDVGTDAGSFGYLNNYLAYGRKSGDYDLSLFASNVIGNGPTNQNLFNTQTVNFLGVYTPTPMDKFTVKVINNTLYSDLPTRLSLNQFYQNPFQSNCYGFSDVGAARGAACATSNIYNNGYSGAQSALTPYQAGFHRHDRRSILGLRWEHNFDENTVWRVQVVADDKNISQPTGGTGAVQDEPSINFITDLTSRWRIFGFDATHFVGAFANTESNTSYTYNVRPGGNGLFGGLTQITPSQQTNAGIRGREEIKLTDALTVVGGWGAEYTNVNGQLNVNRYSAAGMTTTQTSARQEYYNIAPEAALVYRPNSEWLVKARVATGYGTPQAGNLFVLPSGAPGNNTDLKSQTNLGYDLAALWTPLDTVSLSVDGFYEFFRNELVTQTAPSSVAVPSPQAFTFNAPRSEHRGVEVAGEWRFYPGWKAKVAYTYNNQIYTQYFEQLGGAPVAFNRVNHWIPGVAPNELTARLGYDVPFGPLKGLGAFAEYYLTDAFYVDNANYLKVPGYQVVNLNLHYDSEIQDSFVKKIGAYFEVRNVFNNTYIASANNITNTVTNGVQNSAAVLAAGGSATANSGTIYAGFPRVFVGGIRVKF
jgi:iron complex outermembrane receptor protein